MTPSLQDLADQFQRLVAATEPASPPEGALSSGTLPSAAAGDKSAPAPAAPAPVPPAPVQITDYAAKGYHLDVRLGPEQVIAAAELLDKNGLSIDTITGVDWLAENQMEVVYDYFHPAANLRVVVRARVPRATPEIPTISKVFPGANWHERETHDFFGIRFTGHPDLTPLLLPEDATYHPLRKDFSV
jgi:NADH-quinone oxidoreductase subunit C